MGEHLFVSSALLAGIVAFELWRRMKGEPFGMLSVANAVFALNYCVSPIMLGVLPGSGLETGPFGQTLFMLTIVGELGLDSNAYLSGAFLTVLAYGVMVGAYRVVSRMFVPAPLRDERIPTSWLILGGGGLGLVAIAALLIYSAQFNALSFPESENYHTVLTAFDPFGLIKMMKFGGLVRNGMLDVSRGYLQIVVMVGLPGLILLGAAALREKGVRRWGLFAASFVLWLAVLVRVYHASGRMELTVFLAIVPVAVMLGTRSRKALVLGGAVLVVFGLFMSLARQEFFPQPAQGVIVMAEALGRNGVRSVLLLVNEFAFPFPVAAHTYATAPESVGGYRFFMDLPLALAYMLPGGGDWPEMISHIHNRTVPLLLPYDLVSFGIYNAGVAGVVVVFAAFGILLALIDGWLGRAHGWLARALCAAWMLYLPFRIMYADPYTAMKTGFGLIVGTAVVLVLVILANRRATA